MRGPFWSARAFARVASICLAVTALFVSSSSTAQVNAEALRSTLKKNPRFLWLEGAVVGRVGNTETMTFSASAFGGITSEPHLFFSRVSADYGQAQGDTTVARWIAHARYNYLLTSVVALEGLAQVQHDRFRRLAVRDLYGAGLRFTLVTAEDLEVVAGTTYLLEHEVLDAVPGSPAFNNVWHRSSDYVGVNLKVAPLVDASSVTYLQPRFDRPLDFRILSESFVSFTITKILAARISGSAWYDHRPPFGVRTYDVEIKNSLVVKL
jgi:Protein of unknown function, DUF481